MAKVVAGIISRLREDGQTEYLLVKSGQDYGVFTGSWCPPAGHVENKETEEQALIREIKEEVDLEVIGFNKICDTPSDLKGETTHWFICQVSSYNYQIDNKEIIEVGFFTKQQMEKMKIWPATKKFFDNWL